MIRELFINNLITHFFNYLLVFLGPYQNLYFSLVPPRDVSGETRRERVRVPFAWSFRFQHTNTFTEFRMWLLGRGFHVYTCKGCDDISILHSILLRRTQRCTPKVYNQPDRTGYSLSTPVKLGKGIGRL